ncbi:hypothetical protein LCGC14_3031770, partial [marine sediment metagenome]
MEARLNAGRGLSLKQGFISAIASALSFGVGASAGMYFSQWSMASPGLQAIFLRFRFEVPDPAAGQWTLQADYVGGVRFVLNGREIVRASLPDGEIGASAVAKGYGQDAYLRLFDELSEKDKTTLRRKHLKGKAPPKFHGFAGWRTPPDSRIYKARNRALGPLPVPAKLLRKGTNVLAVEIRPASLHPMVYDAHAWISGYGKSSAWLHASLSRLSLRTTAEGVPSGVIAPGGAEAPMQVWAEDMHRRVFSPEYLEPGADSGRLRVVAARNGTYGGQVVVRSGRALSGVRVRCGRLVAAGGKSLPASTVRVFGMTGHPAERIIDLGGRV